MATLDAVTRPTPAGLDLPQRPWVRVANPRRGSPPRTRGAAPEEPMFLNRFARELAGLLVEAEVPNSDLVRALDIVIARHRWPHFAK